MNKKVVLSAGVLLFSLALAGCSNGNSSSSNSSSSSSATKTTSHNSSSHSNSKKNDLSSSVSNQNNISSSSDESSTSQSNSSDNAKFHNAQECLDYLQQQKGDQNWTIAHGNFGEGYSVSETYATISNDDGDQYFVYADGRIEQ